MATPRSTPAQTGSNTALWAAVAVVMVIVLAMGAALIRIQAQPQEPRLVVLPASTAPAVNAPVSAAANSAATGPATTAAPGQPASATESSGTQANVPQTVHLRASEPAVARAPAPGVSR
ncbi:hypothetical protein [Rhodoferax sp.]|uniref:hypothetical protein n=1 Tax=Rhodoferax sp. TaxID=50421 RepID=UPI0025D45461|nr:hypothetical protein [Rhodoferax sp.]MCM2297167.1 hypothetical protein [Rhodoferax sp.]